MCAHLAKIGLRLGMMIRATLEAEIGEKKGLQDPNLNQ
jgi:hypothetical protein